MLYKEYKWNINKKKQGTNPCDSHLDLESCLAEQTSSPSLFMCKSLLDLCSLSTRTYKQRIVKESPTKKFQHTPSPPTLQHGLPSCMILVIALVKCIN